MSASRIKESRPRRGLCSTRGAGVGSAACQSLATCPQRLFQSAPEISAMRAAAHALAPSLANIEPQYGNLGGGNFGWPEDFRETGRDGDFLRSTRRIGDDAATDRTADFPTP